LYKLYREAIAICAAMRSEAAGAFDPRRTHNPAWDAAFARRFESGYFERGLLDAASAGAALRGVDRDALDREFDQLAQRACSGIGRSPGFIHRDFQSRNLMATSSGLAVIDFQGARTGPPEYDLASLLFDPYVLLPADIRGVLLEEALAGARGGLSAERFRACAANRMMQALGAYAYLGRQAGKESFLAHIPAALRHLLELTGHDSPHLHRVASRLAEREA
jgi:aminoglycoside/choline kinase family phosphotransferase